MTETESLAIVLHGATGRMGVACREVLGAEPGVRVATLLAGQAGELAEARVLRAEEWQGEGDVVIDFSRPEALAAIVPLCKRFGVPLVSGTTGLDAAEHALLDDLATTVPVLLASNFSIGLLLLAEACAKLARDLPGYDCEIVETHHRGKVNSPSGTALTLAEAIATARGHDMGDVVRNGRSGRTETRPPGEIGIHALRLGDAIGTHEVSFAGQGETVALRHESRSRHIYVHGALRAARFVRTAPPGRYGLRDAITPA